MGLRLVVAAVVVVVVVVVFTVINLANNMFSICRHACHSTLHHRAAGASKRTCSV